MTPEGREHWQSEKLRISRRLRESTQLFGFFALALANPAQSGEAVRPDGAFDVENTIEDVHEGRVTVANSAMIADAIKSTRAITNSVTRKLLTKSHGERPTDL
jgi:hypothetical protein